MVSILFDFINLFKAKDLSTSLQVLKTIIENRIEKKKPKELDASIAEELLNRIKQVPADLKTNDHLAINKAVAFILGGDSREVVSLSRTNISIRKISPSGRETEHVFNPFWARFLVSRKAKIGITAMHLRGNGRETDIGAFLPLDDRERFASAFSGALARVKRGY